MGKMIKNIGFLDLTNAAKESLEGIETIKNVGCMLYSRQIAPLLSKITLKNVGYSSEVPENCKVVNGQFIIDGSFVSGVKQPLYLFINGQLVVKPDVSVEAIETSISGLNINGTVYCPEHLRAAIEQKIERKNGKVVSFMRDAVLVNGDVRLDNHFLQTMQPETNLAVTGIVRMIDHLDSSLLEERLGKMQFLHEALLREEYLEMLNSRIVNREKSTITVIPSGCIYIDGDLVLDSITIKRFEQAKLYVIGSVRLGDDVSETMLEKHIAQIYTKDMIICRKELAEQLLNKCADPAIHLLTYSGKLLLVDGQHKLTRAELKYTPENISVLVRGMLEIDPNIEPQVLFDKIDSIDNFGEIEASGEQCGVIHAKLRANNGSIIDRDESGNEDNGNAEEDANADDVYIKNVSYLKL